MKPDLFDSACWWSGCRAVWLAAAASNGTVSYPFLTRRQCLHRARQAENVIIDISIKAEIRAQRAVDAAALVGGAA